MKISLQERKVGLALGGGGVLGAAHIGVLKALNELNVSIHAVAGTSIGALIASLFAFGKDWQDIEGVLTDLNWLNASELSLSQYAVLSNKKLGDLITQNLGKVRFEQAKVPLAMVATDISKGQKVILKNGDVSNAVMASTCVPGIFEPIQIQERLLVDGGIVENVPISPLRDLGANFLIGVALGSGSTRDKPENVIDVLLRSFYFTIETATRLRTKDADLVIAPDLSSFSLISTHQTGALIQAGYAETRKILSQNLA